MKKHFIAYYPETFRQEYFPPYFLLAHTIRNSPRTELYAHAKANTSFVALGKVRAEMDDFTPENLKESRDKLHISFWANYMGGINKLTIDSKFFEASNDYYGKNMSDISGCDKDKDKRVDIKKLGFWADSKREDFVTCFNEPTAPSRDLDLKLFVQKVTATSKNAMNRTLKKYPLLKQKYDILIAYFKKHYGVDLQSIGNGKPEFKDK